MKTKNKQKTRSIGPSKLFSRRASVSETMITLVSQLSHSPACHSSSLSQLEERLLANTVITVQICKITTKLAHISAKCVMKKISSGTKVY